LNYERCKKCTIKLILSRRWQFNASFWGFITFFVLMKNVNLLASSEKCYNSIMWITSLFNRIFNCNLYVIEKNYLTT
jgi:hypothetical protein